MAKLNGDIKKLKRGELAGTAAIFFCLAVLIFFAISFTVARVQEIKALYLTALIASPILLAAGAGVAAFCNVKYGGAIERAIKAFVRDTCVENAAFMHPERNSLTFYVCLEGSTALMRVNGYKEKITFDFSPLGKLSITRRAAVLNEIGNTLCATFCRLYERGADYADVSYSLKSYNGPKPGKIFYIIKDSQPDKKAFKQYLKNKSK